MVREMARVSGAQWRMIECRLAPELAAEARRARARGGSLRCHLGNLLAAAGEGVPQCAMNDNESLPMDILRQSFGTCPNGDRLARTARPGRNGLMRTPPRRAQVGPRRFP
jgi:hypothetical protein